MNILTSYDGQPGEGLFTDTLNVPCDLKPLSAYSTQELIDEILRRDQDKDKLYA